jgi:large subunit ribosomal protein L35
MIESLGCSSQAAAKRFKVTGSGKVTVRHAGKNHFQEKKSGKRKQKLSMKHVASDTQLDNIKGCLPYAKIQ